MDGRHKANDRVATFMMLFTVFAVFVFYSYYGWRIERIHNSHMYCGGYRCMQFAESDAMGAHLFFWREKKKEHNRCNHVTTVRRGNITIL